LSGQRSHQPFELADLRIRRGEVVKTISREALYEQVWARPMIEVAASYGITGTGLKKACKRHQIPTPERGYWAKLAHGKTVRQKPLPKLTDESLARITITGRWAAQSEGVRRAKAQARERLANAAPPEAHAKTKTPRTAEPPPEPPILAATRRAISKVRADAQGFAAIQGAGIAQLRVAPASIDRALSILSQLLALAAHQGYGSRAVDAGLALVIDDEPVPLGIEEKPQKIAHEPTPAERKRQSDYERWGSSHAPWPKYDYSPSGRLALVIHANEYGGLRRTYADGKTRRLEDLLAEVLVGCAEHAAMIKEQRTANEERARRWREEEACRAREAAYQAREKRRMEFADAIHTQLVQRAKLSAVLVHLENTASGTGPGPKGMASWVRARIQEIDALIGPTFLDLSARFAKLDFDKTHTDTDAKSDFAYYSPRVELHFWSIDEEKEQARSISALQWATENGLMPGPESADAEK
jgi:hypothetical protein